MLDFCFFPKPMAASGATLFNIENLNQKKRAISLFFYEASQSTISKFWSILLLLFSLNLFYSPSVFAQPGCGDIKLRVGAAEELNCYELRIPIFLETPSDTTLEDFWGCGMDVTATVTGVNTKASIIGVGNNDNGFDQHPLVYGYSTVTFSSSYEPVEYDLNRQIPNFFIEVKVVPELNSGITLSLEVSSFELGTQSSCDTTTVCSIEQSDITYTNPISGPQPASACSGNPDFDVELIIDANEANLGMTDTVFVFIKGNPTPMQNEIAFERLDLKITIDDRFNNLQIDVPNNAVIEYITTTINLPLDYDSTTSDSRFSNIKHEIYSSKG